MPSFVELRPVSKDIVSSIMGVNRQRMDGRPANTMPLPPAVGYKGIKTQGQDQSDSQGQEQSESQGQEQSTSQDEGL